MDDVSNVGLSLVTRFRDTVGQQVHRAIARHIRTKVRDARSDADTAARRWPFELIQNAHDAGPRDGRDGITLSFDLSDGVLLFEHDAKPFNMNEFAALVTGGSSKDFLSTETTGRFGTGFLVTHVLSQQVDVFGILDVDQQRRAFSVELDRPDDEDLILENIKESEGSLESTRLVDDFDSVPTAIFEYELEDHNLALAGLDAIESSLPYLFATCRKLREIRIRRETEQRIWRSSGSKKPSRSDGIWLSEFDVSLIGSDGAQTDWRVLRAATPPFASGSLVVALRKEDDAWAVCKPDGIPSVFRQLPILGGPVLPAWLIVDGQFDVEQERRSIHVSGEAARPLQQAFGAFGGLMLLANREGWINGFRLAQLAMPAEVSGDTATKVWSEILLSAAEKASRLPIVTVATGDMLPCVADSDEQRFANFIRRQLPGPTFDELWELAATCTSLDPPAEDVAEGWSEVAEGWEQLGINVSWIDLASIGEEASAGVREISDLDVDGDPYVWLSRYLDAVGRMWQVGGIIKSLVRNLLPDQHGILRDADELRRDAGVTVRLKEIAAEMGLDIKAQVVDQRLVDELTEQKLSSGLHALGEASGSELDESEAIDDLARHLSASFPEDQKLNDKNESVAAASINLLTHLWSSRGKAAEGVVWKIPLLSADGRVRYARPRSVMAPPVCSWPEKAQRFSEAYLPSRLLSDRYADADGSLLDALATWGIVHRHLVIRVEREELRDRALKAIAADQAAVSEAVLREAELPQIALLEPELINYCRQSRERAKALLGLVVCSIAEEDTSWREPVEMSVKAPEGEKRVYLTPSLWLSDLKSKPWIPIEDEKDITHHIPNPELVRGLLDPSWLEGNRSGADLLVRHFGIDALEVQLLAAASDEESRKKLRDSLAKIIEVVGGNSQMIEGLVATAQQQQRNVNRMRKLGLAVQAGVQSAMEDRGLNVGEIDHGYDFWVTAVGVREDKDPDEMSAYFEVTGYKVEVKATTTGDACLTPLQAKTSVDDPEKFVLCVVDLRDYVGDVHQAEWSVAEVAARSKLISGSQLPISDTLSFVDLAEDSDVPIRNTTALRYAVGADLWEAGLGFDEWVEAAF